MLKAVIAATALFAIAGSSYVYAQQGYGGHGGYGDGGARFEHRHRPSAADVSAFADARIAALKAGLEMTPDQAKNWPPFEQAVRDLVQLRVQRIQARQSADQTPPTSPFDRMARRADNMSKTSAALKKIADAGAPLYQTLDRFAERPLHDAGANAAPAPSHARRERSGLPSRGRLRPRRRRERWGPRRTSLRPERRAGRANAKPVG